MRRFFFSHLGTILVVCLVAVAGFLALRNPERAKEAFQAAWAGAPAAASEGDEQADSAASIWATISRSELFSGTPPEQWVVVLAAVLVGFIAGKIAAAVARRVGRAMEKGGRTAQSHVVDSAASPLSLTLFTFGLSIGVAVLTQDKSHVDYLWQAIRLLYVLAAVWYVYNLVELIDIGFEHLRGRIESRLDAQLVPLIRKSLRVVLVLLAFLYVAKNVFNQPVGTWLAGLGIAGLAVSLAAQDSLKNLFGSITILLDRTYKVGERIIYSGYDGVIEDIGFRSTKVRTAAGHLVTVPNGNIVNSPVENVGRRPFIRRTLNVTITYDTPREKIDEGIAILKRILEEDGIREPIHPKLEGNEYPPRVFFNDFNADSLNLFVMYWYAPPAWWDYMEHAERLNLRIFEEYDRAGIEFAFPTQTLFLAGDPKRKLALEMLGEDLKR